MSGRHRRAEAPTGSRRRPAYIAVGVAAAAAVALSVTFALAGGDDDHPSAGGPASTPPTTLARTSAAPTRSLPPSTPASTTASPSPRATRTTSRPPAPPARTLVVRADRGNSWLVVRDATGRQRYNALLPRGRSQHFDGPFFTVVLGDAAVVDVVVNGTHRPRGRPGQVERFTVRGR